MPFKITKTETPSNKAQILFKNGPIQPLQAQYDGKCPQPFIDRMTVTLTVPEGQHGKDMYQAHFQTLDDAKVFQQVKKSSSLYKLAYRLKLQSVNDAKKWPFYEFAWQDNCITRLRIEFVPVDLGWEGMVELHAILISLMDGGWGFIAQHGRISRLDVTVDFPNVQMNELHLLPKKAATTQQWSHEGKLQTFQAGKPKGDHTQIYDRKAKRAAHGKAWQGKTGIRIERRLINLGIGVGALPLLPNPFAAFNLVQRTPSLPPCEKKAYIWELFLDSCEVRGMTAALAKLPQQKRTAYRKHLKKHVVDWFDVDKIWLGWAKMLDELKIAQPSAWT